MPDSSHTCVTFALREAELQLAAVQANIVRAMSTLPDTGDTTPSEILCALAGVDRLRGLLDTIVMHPRLKLRYQLDNSRFPLPPMKPHPDAINRRPRSLLRRSPK